MAVDGDAVRLLDSCVGETMTQEQKDAIVEAAVVFANLVGPKAWGYCEEYNKLWVATRPISLARVFRGKAYIDTFTDATRIEVDGKQVWP